MSTQNAKSLRKIFVLFLFLTLPLFVSAAYAASECSDGIDNDHDGLTDWQLDLGCYNASDSSEGSAKFEETQNNWTVFEQKGKNPTDQKIIYVSSSTGKDSNSGTSPSSPFKTLAKGYSQLRDQHADWLLLKRGDKWLNENFPDWNFSGKSPQERMVVASYGASQELPKIYTASAAGIMVTGKPVNNLVIKDLAFLGRERGKDDTILDRKGNYGIFWASDADSILVEGCVFNGYMTNLAFQSQRRKITNLVLRRNIVTDAFKAVHEGVWNAPHPQGLYTEGMVSFTIEENLFDHNGWYKPYSSGSQFDHNLYLAASSDLETVPRSIQIRGNIIARGGSHGLQARQGGTIENNLFLDNAIHLAFSQMHGALVSYGGAFGKIQDNVFTGSRVIGEEPNAGPRGAGIELANLRPIGRYGSTGTQIENNLFAFIGKFSGGYRAIDFTAPQTAEEKRLYGIKDLTLQNNIVYKWSGILQTSGLSVKGELTQQNNLYDATPAGKEIGSKNEWDQKNFKSPVSLSDYNACGSSEDNFLALARKQTRFNWNPACTAAAFNDFMRKGFGAKNTSSGGTVTPEPEPQPDPETQTEVPVPVNETFSQKGYGKYSDFDYADASHWIVASDPTDQDKKLFLAATDYNLNGAGFGEYALVKNKTLGDFEISFTVRSAEKLKDNPKADYSVVFGFKDARNFCYLSLNAYSQFSELVVVRNGTRSSAYSLLKNTIPNENYHRAKLKRTSNEISFWWDDQLIMKLDKGALSKSSSLTEKGQLGVGSFNDSAYFDDIEIK